MSRTAKKMMVFCLILLLVVGIALAFLLQRFNPNDLKPVIAEKVTQLTGRPFHIDGDISWSFIPWVGVKIEKITLEDAPSSGRPAMAVIGSAKVKVALFPLFKKEIHADEIVFQDLQVRLVHESGHEPNWAFLKHLSTKNNDAQSTPIPSQKGHQSWFSLDKLQVDTFSVQNGNIYFRDQNKTIEVKNVDLETKDLGSAKPAPITLSFTLKQGSTSESSHKGKASFEFKQADHLISLQDVVWVSRIHDARLPQKDLELAIKTAFEYNLNQDSLAVEKFEAKAGGALLSGSLKATQISNHFDFNGSFKLAGHNPTELMATLSAISPLSLDLESARKFNIATVATGNLNSVVLKHFSLQIGKTEAEGQANLRMTEHKNSLTFNVKANQFDLALLNSKEAETSNKKSEVKVVNSPAPKTNWQVEGGFQLQQLLAGDLSLQQIKSKIYFEDETLHISDISATLLGSPLTADVKGLLRNTPEWNVQAAIKQLPIRPLLEKLGKTPFVQGLFDLAISLRTKGADKTAFIRNSNGNGQFFLKDGQINGFDVNYYVQTAQNLGQKLRTSVSADPNSAQGASSTEPQDRGHTPIQHLSGSFNLAAGVIFNQDLDIQSEQLGITGKGKIDLNSNSLDYGVLAAPYKVENGERKKRGTVPLALKVIGTFDSPKVIPDMEAYTHLYLQQAVQDKAEKLLEKSGKDLLNGKLGKELKKALDLQKIMP